MPPKDLFSGLKYLILTQAQAYLLPFSSFCSMVYALFVLFYLTKFMKDCQFAGTPNHVMLEAYIFLWYIGNDKIFLLFWVNAY